MQQLEKDQIIDRALYYRLYSGEAMPCIYGLPKIHKEGAPLRTISSCINSVTYEIAKHWATILAPLLGKTTHHIQSSQHFLNKVKDVKLVSDCLYDATSLFTFIPATEAEPWRNVFYRITHCLTERISFQTMPALLDLSWLTTYFQF